ncbi:MAG: DUF418 domain-containing protein [Candidatus Krumholzibacteriia bacterium]
MTVDPPASGSPAVLPAGPALGPDRIEALDVLRGLAVLGILLMNIQSFGSPGDEYMNPAARGTPSGLDLAIWATSHVLADSKFMTLFSVLFGVGIAIFAGRLEHRGRKPAGLHYRRMGWLWLIGMLHGYLLWYGDILVSYAVCGMVVFWLRSLRARWQMLVGTLMIAVPSLLLAGLAAAVPHLPPEALDGLRESWQPSGDAVARELAAMRGSWLQQMPQRAAETFNMQTLVHLLFVAWRCGSLMLWGMAGLQLGVVTAGCSRRFYLGLLAVGAGVGLPLILLGLRRNLLLGFDMEDAMLRGFQFNYWGSLGLAAAYLALVMLMVQSRSLPAVRRSLAAAGRMAFSNYLGQTVICTTIFYGHGFGLFGRTERWQQLAMVLAIWALQLAISSWWLARFRFGPMEWLWRSLTYWRRQPLRRQLST